MPSTITKSMAAIAVFTRKFLHHFTCDAASAFPWDGYCTYQHCGNWMNNRIQTPSPEPDRAPPRD